VLGEGVLDLLVQALQALVLGQDGAGELGDDAGCHVLPGKHRLLGLSGPDRSGRDICVAADPALPQPPRQPRFPHTADRLRGGVAGQQD
jgi:hypothetical protein